MIWRRHSPLSAGGSLSPSPPAPPLLLSLVSSEMAKSKNHTNHNQNYKAHRNGIKKPKRVRWISTKGVRCAAPNPPPPHPARSRSGLAGGGGGSPPPPGLPRSSEPWGAGTAARPQLAWTRRWSAGGGCSNATRWLALR
jgi:hypothetical protein